MRFKASIVWARLEGSTGDDLGGETVVFVASGASVKLVNGAEGWAVCGADFTKGLG